MDRNHVTMWMNCICANAEWIQSCPVLTLKSCACNKSCCSCHCFLPFYFFFSVVLLNMLGIVGIMKKDGWMGKNWKCHKRQNISLIVSRIFIIITNWLKMGHSTRAILVEAHGKHLLFSIVCRYCNPPRHVALLFQATAHTHTSVMRLAKQALHRSWSRSVHI